MTKQRAGDPRERQTLSVPSDGYFHNQWHLLNTGQNGGRPGVDLDVVPVWEDYTGAGVVVGVWDDGVEYSHPDLDDNYDASRNLSLRGRIHDPAPESAESMHGTSVAGVIAAEANGRGTVGVAYDATLVGVDIFYDSQVTDYAFRQLDQFDVTNHSWGYTSAYGANVEASDWKIFFAGWKRSVETGRDGLGTINVIAAGNDRTSNADTNHSNLSNMPEVITVAAVGHDGSVSWYSTPGASVLVAAPSNGPDGSGIWTTDRVGTAGYNAGKTPPPASGYTDDFGGTSSATPAVTGVVALMLEANPHLGWRDVQQILAMTARHVGSGFGDTPEHHEKFAWSFNAAQTWNGGGMHFSNDYGFGIVDARAAVRLAETWIDQQTSDNWQRATGDRWDGTLAIPDDDLRGVHLTFDVTSDITLERIGLKLAISNGFSGDYRVVLVSPSGTRSVLSTDHAFGDSTTDSWLYASNAFRGEDATGQWTLAISDRWASDRGRLTSARLDLSGAAATDDDTWIFTDEMSKYSGRLGHTATIGDDDGGADTLNAAALSTPVSIDLMTGLGVIDAMPVKLVGRIVNVATGDAADTIVGSAGGNLLYAGRANDHVAGRAGDDWVLGGDGNDVLRDGDGRDWMRGGFGDDRIVLGTDGFLDRVLGFRQGDDVIQLSGVTWRDLGLEDTANGVLVTLPDDRLLIRDLTVAELSRDDFLFV